MGYSLFGIHCKSLCLHKNAGFIYENAFIVNIFHESGISYFTINMCGSMKSKPRFLCVARICATHFLMREKDTFILN